MHIIVSFRNIKRVFEVQYSLEGTEERKEEATYINFIDFLEKCAGVMNVIIIMLNNVIFGVSLDGDVTVDDTKMGSEPRNETVT